MRVSDYSFKPTAISLLLVAVLIPLFISLGFWQLDRAKIRESLIERRHEAGQRAPLAESDLFKRDPESLRFRVVRLRGRWDAEHPFLLDNQLNEGRSGYQVIVPFRPEGRMPAVLVNLGWVPAERSRNERPQLKVLPSGLLEIKGQVDLLYRVGYQLEGMTTPSDGWPSVVQVPEPGPIAQRLGYPVLGLQLQLDPKEPGRYSQTTWGALPDPGQNRGYALQWFLFAFMTGVLFMKHSIHVHSKP